MVKAKTFLRHYFKMLKVLGKSYVKGKKKKIKLCIKFQKKIKIVVSNNLLIQQKILNYL